MILRNGLSLRDARVMWFTTLYGKSSCMEIFCFFALKNREPFPALLVCLIRKLPIL